MTLFLNMSKVRQFDVLLTAEDQPSSRAIRTMQAVRYLRNTRFSHASLFLNSSMIAESDSPGTIVTNLVKVPLLFNAAPGANIRCRLVDRKLAVFAKLSPKSDAEVVRPKVVKNWLRQQFESARAEAIEVLLPLYLAQYASGVHFMGASGFIPRPAQEYLEQMLAQWAQRYGDVAKNPTGTFCSELVSLLLAAVGAIKNTDHSQVVPGHFEWDTDQFEVVPGAVIDGEGPLPGTPCSPHLEEGIGRLLRTFWGQNQDRSAKILALAQSRLTQGSELASNLQREMLSKIWAELLFPDSCWDWVAQVNHCAVVCPGGSDWDIFIRKKVCNRRVEVREFALKPVAYPTSACDGGSLPYSCLTYGSELDQLILARSQRTVPIELRPDSGQ